MDIEKLVAERQWNPVTAVLKAVIDVVATLIRALRDGYQMARTYRSLSALSDRELKAIGLKRVDIGTLVVDGLLGFDVRTQKEEVKDSYKAAA